MIDVAKRKISKALVFKGLSEDCQEYYFDFEAYADQLEASGRFIQTKHGIFEIPE